MHPSCQKWTSEPHIPVDFTAMYTSPGARFAPDETSSREGEASDTQRSWLGLVKTPMLGLEASVPVSVTLDIVVVVDMM